MESKFNLSVIIAVLDSHDVVKRQLLHFMSMEFNCDEVEFIIVDDGSNIPLKNIDIDLTPNICFIETYDKRPWSQPCARNVGSSKARSDKLLMTDIDHILSKEAIEFCLKSNVDKIMFPRQWGILNEEGRLSQERDDLFEYGLDKKLFELRHLSGGMHHNTFMIKKEIFNMLGGYDESFCGKYGGDDTDFARRYGSLFYEGKVSRHIIGPAIYVYPDPHNDVKQIFHKLRNR